MKKTCIFLVFLANALTAQVNRECELWGTTVTGGGGGFGAVFTYNLATDSLQKRVHFIQATRGYDCQSSLTLASDGKLYGMTRLGGISTYTNCAGCGTLFSVDPLTDSLTKLYDFDFSDWPGALPLGTVIQGTDGFIYGLTQMTDSFLIGSLFQYDPVSKAMITKYKFAPSGGYSPWGSLVQANNGLLYGMAAGGALYGEGSIFSFDPLSGSYSKLHDFNSVINGSKPEGDLIQANDGLLYGLVPNGGQFYNGILFSYDISTSTFSKKIDLHYTNGGYCPLGSLLQASNGKLYGMMSKGGANNMGTLFEYDMNTNTITDKFSFSSSMGKFPKGSLMQASNGKIYGTTPLGGAFSGGTLFEYDPVTDTLIKKADFNPTSGMKPQKIRLLEICRVVSTETLTVIPPNIFSPNGDGINDEWTPLINYKSLLKDIEITVYNRWGNKVFSSLDKSAVWNGNSLTGQPCLDGTYYYYINYTDNNTKMFSQKGFITLIH